jgi:hypothetical protein
MKATLAILLLCLGVTSACSAPEAKRKAVRPTLVEAPAPDYRLCRTDYDQAIVAGQGKALRWYLLGPAYDIKGTFRGHLIKAIIKEELKTGPLFEGDVIVAINGRPVEKPGEFQTVWTELPGRPNLLIRFARGTKLLELNIPIVDCER